MGVCGLAKKIEFLKNIFEKIENGGISKHLDQLP